jgi:PAS domain S-box-containing protein
LYSFSDRKAQDDLKYVGLVVLLFLVQAMLIVGLLWQRARNRNSDLRLRESEKRFRLMADTTPALIWMSDKEGTVTYLNDRLINFIGRDPATGLGDAWSAFIHPDDVQSVQAANKRSLEQQQEFSKEYRLRRQDGVYRWMLVRRLTLQTRKWHRRHWRKLVAN